MPFGQAAGSAAARRSLYCAAAMAEIAPLKTVRYDLDKVDSLEAVIAPPYDVIDAEQRAALLAQSPANVVEIDLPVDPDGGDIYDHAAETFAAWRADGTLLEEDEPAYWALEQRYDAPDGRELVRTGFFARVKVEDYGPGQIRPHERTHPGPKEDRLRLTRATKANLSPIFSLFPDPEGVAPQTLAGATAGEPFATAKDGDGTLNTLWRVADEAGVAALTGLLDGKELLIADGHHRYETARVYHEEVGDEGGYVLMFLCALTDPGLTVFPTHRLLTDLADHRDKQEAIRDALKRDFEVEEVERAALEPAGDPDGRVQMGYMDAFHKQPYLLTLKDQSIADAALEGKPEPYRRLDTAVLEAIILKGALGLSEDDISHLNGLAYSKNFEDAAECRRDGPRGRRVLHARHARGRRARGRRGR